MQHINKISHLDQSIYTEQDEQSHVVPIDYAATQEIRMQGTKMKEKETIFVVDEERKNIGGHVSSEWEYDSMYGPGLTLKSLCLLRRACRRSVYLAIYQDQGTSLGELKQICYSMVAAVPSLRCAKGEIVKTLDCLEAAGMASQDNMRLTLAIQKELSHWDDLLQVVVRIIAEKETAIGNVTGEKERFTARYYTVLESVSRSAEDKALYRIVAKDSASAVVAEELERFNFKSTVSE